MYYGDEIGMPRVEVAPQLVQDPWEKNEPGLGVGRDPSRTPMQWDASVNAGFSDAPPWLPLEPRYEERNIALLRNDPRSILSLYRGLTEIRRAYPALNRGDSRVISAEHNVLIYERIADEQRIVLMLNFGPDARPLPASGSAKAHVLLSTHLGRESEGDIRELRGNEGLVVLANSDEL
jgi:alpha-glucosidase